MRIVSQAGVEIEPVDTGFATDLGRQLQRDVDAATRGIHPDDIEIGLEVAKNELRRKIEAEVKAIEKTVEANIPMDADGLGFRTAVAKAVKEVEAGLKAKIPTEPGSAAEYLQKLRAQVNDVSKVVRAHVETDVDRPILAGGRGGFLGGISNLFSGLMPDFSGATDGVFQLTKGIGLSTDAMGKLGGVATEVLGTVVGLAAKGALLAVVGAAVSVAWGAVSTAIAAVPAAIGLIGGPLAAVALGMDGIKKAAATIKPQFDALKASVSSVFEQGLTPVLKNIADNLFPQLKSNLGGVAQSLVTLAKGMGDFLTSTRGLELIQTMFDGVKQALLDMQPGLQSLAEGFLRLAGNGAALDAIVGTFNALGEAVKKISLNENLDAAFRGLGATLRIVTTGFGDLVSKGIDLFSRAAPGANAALESVFGFFRKFDFAALGTSVGKVFQGIADGINKIDPATFGKIQDAFGKLGDAFANPALSSTIAAIIDNLPTAIDLVTKFVDFLGKLGAIGQTLKPISDFFGDLALGGLLGKLPDLGSMFSGLGDSLGSVFSGIKDKIAAAFSGIDLSGAFSTVVSSVSGFLSGLGSSIASGASAAWGFLTSTLGGAISGIGGFLAGIPGVVSGFLSGLGSLVASLATAAWNFLWFSLQTSIDLVGTILTNLPVIIGTVLGTLAGVVIGLAQVAWNFLWNTLPAAIAQVGVFLAGLPAQVGEFLAGLGAGIAAAATAAWNWLWQTIPAAVAAVGAFLASLPGTVAGLLASLASTVATAARTAWTWLVTTATQLGGQAVSFVATLPGKIGAALSSLVSVLVNAAKSAFSGMLSAVQSGIASVISAVQSLPGKIQSFFAGAGSWLVAAGKALVQGFINGISSMISAAASAAASVAAKVRGFFPGSPAKEGPFSGSGYILFSGRSMIDDFAAGLLESRAGLAAAVSQVLGSVSGQFDALNLGVQLDPAVASRIRDSLNVSGSAPAAAAAPGGGVSFTNIINAQPGQSPSQIATETMRQAQFSLRTGMSSLVAASL